jgi:hypothetical protein
MPIADIVLDQSRPNGPEVDFSFDSKDGKHAFVLNLIKGANISAEAVLSINLHPTSSRTNIGKLGVISRDERRESSGFLLRWSLPFFNRV